MANAKPENRLATALENSAKSSKEGRLIVRNLGFNVTKEQIQERFSDYGELVDVHLPSSKRTNNVLPDGRHMKVPAHAGYAFVEFDNRDQAKAAIEAINETRLGGRRVAVDFAYDIRLYKQATKAKSNGSVPTDAAGEESSEAKATEETSSSFNKKRHIMSENQTVIPETVVSTPVNKKHKSEVRKERPVVDQTSTKPAFVKKVEQKNTDPAKPVSGADANARKLFLLNLPYDAEVADVYEGICAFGKISASDIESVLLVKDGNGKFAGKAFVLLKEVSVAQKLLDLENSSIPEAFGELYKKTAVKSVAAVAPLETGGCIVKGRRIALLKTLSKEEVAKQKELKGQEDKPKSAKVLNKTHMNLINAGWIGENSPEWDTLSPQEQRMRTAANEEKKYKLNNANFVINTKRLTIRNIPKQFENGDLQRAIVKAMGIVGSKKVKRSGLKKVAIVKDKIVVAAENPNETKTSKKEKSWSMDMPESEDEDAKVDTVSGSNIPTKTKKKSRGFAFADFSNTEAALKCLTAMNNVVGAFGEGIARKPVVEFAFDDVRKLQIQQDRLDKQSSFKNNLSAVKVDPKKDESKKSLKTVKSEIAKKKRLGRGQKQREKRRAAKEAKKSA